MTSQLGAWKKTNGVRHNLWFKLFYIGCPVYVIVYLFILFINGISLLKIYNYIFYFHLSLHMFGLWDRRFHWIKENLNCM
mgnify:CR=1 FL=1